MRILIVVIMLKKGIVNNIQMEVAFTVTKSAFIETKKGILIK